MVRYLCIGNDNNDAERRVYGKNLAKKAEMFCFLFCSLY